MADFSISESVRPASPLMFSVGDCSPMSPVRSSGVMVLLSQNAEARSMRFSSWRTLPGQLYCWSFLAAAWLMVIFCCARCFETRSRKCSARGMISCGRSLSAGSLMGMTLIL